MANNVVIQSDIMDVLGQRQRVRTANYRGSLCRTVVQIKEKLIGDSWFKAAGNTALLFPIGMGTSIDSCWFVTKVALKPLQLQLVLLAKKEDGTYEQFFSQDLVGDGGIAELQANTVKYLLPKIDTLGKTVRDLLEAAELYEKHKFDNCVYVALYVKAVGSGGQEQKAHSDSCFGMYFVDGSPSGMGTGLTIDRPYNK